MRYMILVKATKESEAGTLPTAEKMAAMAAYHEKLAEAGVLLDASGLRASAHGWKVRYSEGRREVVDGPFTEAKEMIAGFTTIQVRTREEALEWTRRFPNPTLDDGDCEIEVRRMFELEDFEPNPAVERFRELGVGGEKR